MWFSFMGLIVAAVASNGEALTPFVDAKIEEESYFEGSRQMNLPLQNMVRAQNASCSFAQNYLLSQESIFNPNQ